MQEYLYLIINFACIFIPFLASFYPKHSFIKELRWFLPANLLVAIFFLIWDEIFTQQGIWGFNSNYLMGVYLGNLPLEEILFFVCIPYACVFTYFALQYLLVNNPLEKWQKRISVGLIITFTITIFLVNWKWYTGLTSVFSILFLSYALIFSRNLAYAYLSYLIILPFFFLSNGILTGSFLDSPIVWYNNQENLGIRMFTIPIEDTFYGMLLIFLNIELYEFLKQKYPSQKNMNI